MQSFIKIGLAAWEKGVVAAIINIPFADKTAKKNVFNVFSHKWTPPRLTTYLHTF